MVSATLFIFTIAAQRPGATFLLIPPSAKATAMAYAYTAICNDASTNYYNAAGLAFFKSPKITVDYCGYLNGLAPDMHYFYCGFTYPLATSAWGFDIMYYTPGTIELRNFEGVYLGSYRIWRLALKLNYSRRFSKKLSLGIGWKYIKQQYGLWDSWGWYGDETGSSWAFDFNLLYKILPNLSIGTVLHNIGPKIKYSDDPLPWTYRLGIAYKPVDTKNFSCAFSAEITKILIGMFAIEENSFWENFKYEWDTAWKGIGIELLFYKVVSLRGGYFYDEEGARKGLTFGGGIKLVNFELDIGIDENIFEFETQDRKISLSYTF